jgi:hypothetical protein
MQRKWGLAGSLGVIAGGLLIDLDHLVDYAWTRLRGEKSHYLAPFHGWELAGLVTALASFATQRLLRQSPLPGSILPSKEGLDHYFSSRWFAAVLSGLAAGMWLHLVHDVLTNRPRHVGVYSLLYRLRHGFRREITGWTEHTGFHNWSHLPWYRWF